MNRLRPHAALAAALLLAGCTSTPPSQPAVSLAEPAVFDLERVPVAAGGMWAHGASILGSPVPPHPAPVPGDYRLVAAVSGLPSWLPLSGHLVQDGALGRHAVDAGAFSYENQTFWLEWKDSTNRRDHDFFEVRLGGPEGPLVATGTAGLRDNGGALKDAGLFAAVNGSIRVDPTHMVHVDARNLPVVNGLRYGAWLNETTGWRLIGMDDGDDAFHVMLENATAGAEVIVALQPESCIEACSPPWWEPWAVLTGTLA